LIKDKFLILHAKIRNILILLNIYELEYPDKQPQRRLADFIARIKIADP